VKAVFVTGATGMVGRALVRRLLGQGVRVRALARASSNSSELAASGVELVRGDLRDARALADAMRGCDRVFHVAGLVSYRRADAERMYETNVIGTRHVLWAAMEAGVERVVHTSSTAAVGLSDREAPLDEEARFDPELRGVPYMWMKHLAEVELLEAVKAGLDAVMVNPSTIIGSGDVHLNTGKLFKQIARGSLRFAPPGGNSVVALEDVVDGHLLAMERGATGRRYIVNGENLRQVELLTRIAHALGRPAVESVLPRWTEKPLKVAARFAELSGGALTPQVIFFSFRYRYFSAARARAELGWAPRMGVDAAIADAARWYAENGVLDSPSGGGGEGKERALPAVAEPGLAVQPARRTKNPR
jgi:dihydroflavonol-4-reductase